MAFLSLSLVLWTLLALFLLSVLVLTFRYIPNDRVGIVEKLWSASGSVKTGLIALERRGRLPARGAARRLALAGAVPVPRPQDAARDDPAGQDRLRLRARRPAARRRRRRSRATSPPTTSRTSPAFLRAGGQRGPQRKILREGTYAINLAQFVVITAERIYFLPLDASDERDVQADGRGDRRARAASSRSSSRAPTT